MYKAPMDDNDEWRAALGTLPEVLGPADLETLNEGLRYLFKELREAQTAFVGGSHLDGVYLALVAIYAFVSLFRAAGTEGLMGASHGTGERIVRARRWGHRAALKAGRPGQIWAAAGIPIAPRIFRHGGLFS